MNSSDSSGWRCPHGVKSATRSLEPSGESADVGEQDMCSKKEFPANQQMYSKRPAKEVCTYNNPGEQGTPGVARPRVADSQGVSSDIEDQSISEAPHDASWRGLDHPSLVSYTIEQMEAQTRSTMARWAFMLFGLVLVFQLITVVVCTLMGVPTGDLINFFQTATSVMLSVVSLALGYYFGARSARGRGGRG